MLRERSSRGWAEVNDYDARQLRRGAETLQKTQYKEVPLADFKESFKVSKYYTSAEWKKLYADGTVTKWLQQVTDFFVVAGNIAKPGAGVEVLRSEALPARRCPADRSRRTSEHGGRVG